MARSRLPATPPPINRVWFRLATSGYAGVPAVQRKASVTAVDDPVERAANEQADAVMRMAAPAADPVKIAGDAERESTAGGEVLPGELRSFFEPRFRYSFGNVRLHTGAEAAASARAMGANAYTVGENIVFGEGQYTPGTAGGRRLLAHELAHVVQQSGSSPRVQRQAASQTEQTVEMLRIYSFGPSGAGRMETASGLTIFPPAAPVDSLGELVQAGTAAEPKLFRLSRYFSIDDRSRPYPAPVPPGRVKYVTEWTPDDGSAQIKTVQESATTYYGPGETLGTTLGTECVFPNDRPGRLLVGYLLYGPSGAFIIMAHSIHFVNDPSAPHGATVLATDGRHSCQE